MKIASFLLAAMLASGCASGPSPELLAQRAYVEANRPLALNGTMKWSEYLTGLYSKLLDARAPASVLSSTNDLIRYAQQYETGAITKEAFDHQRRSANIAVVAGQQAAAERERARQAAAWAALAAPQPAPVDLGYQIVRTPPLGNSAPLLNQPLEQPSGVTAYFTGRQKQVQTVTYQFGWECEYRYGANTFTRVFVSNCPGTVQVQ